MGGIANKDKKQRQKQICRKWGGANEAFNAMLLQCGHEGKKQTEGRCARKSSYVQIIKNFDI